jgi:hypothetical protein
MVGSQAISREPCSSGGSGGDGINYRMIESAIGKVQSANSVYNLRVQSDKVVISVFD